MDTEDSIKLKVALKDLARLQREVSIMNTELTANTVLTKKIDTSTAEMIQMFETLKGGFKTLEYIGKLAKPLAWLIGLSTTMGVAWYNFKHLLASFFRG